MYLVKPITIEQRKTRLDVLHYLMMGDVELGYVATNIFGRQVSDLPYVFKWRLFKKEEGMDLFYARSIQECVEVVKMEVQETIALLLQ